MYNYNYEIKCRDEQLESANVQQSPHVRHVIALEGRSVSTQGQSVDVERLIMLIFESGR
jgi:hypothetical protein